MSRFYCATLFVFAIASITFAQHTSTQKSVFPPGVSGEFVSRDLATGTYFRVNPAGCKKRFAPYSTFKIPNTLIGLETGVISDPAEKWHWDAAKYPVPNPSPGADYEKIWKQDLDLRTALANSIVWYYRELATRVGQQRMQEWLKNFDYGNQDTSAGLDRFWLGNSLRISPEEQVVFLTKLERGEFPVAKKNLELVKEILTRETTPEYRWIGKTGSSFGGEGWMVGWVERPNGSCTYALHLKASSYAQMAKIRPEIAKALLKQAGCLGGINK